MIEFLTLAGGGLAAGALGGLLGIGGGIVLMPLLRFVVGLEPATAAGTCVTAVFFTTLGGAYRHLRLGNLRWRPLAPVVAAGVVTTVACSLAFTSMAHHGRCIDLGVAVVFLAVSARMITDAFRGLRTEEPNDRQLGGPPGAKAAIGAAAGVLPGLLGIGTGALLVPAFTFLLRTPVKVAMAASLACFCVNALVSAGFKAAQGFVDLSVAVPVCAGTAIGANLGALANQRSRAATLKLAFGLLFFGVAAKFFSTFARTTS